jgi:anti-sigma B factor antagonist/stage II sporulation protein AA (anti-sigma F factor antagonist)
MECAGRRYADVVVVAPVGRLDHGSAGEFEKVLLPLIEPAVGAPDALVLDFTRIEYISSVGLRVLMIAAKKVRGRGGRIAIVGMQPVVAEIFAISRFHNVLEVFESAAGALAAISPAAAAVYGAQAGTATP